MPLFDSAPYPVRYFAGVPIAAVRTSRRKRMLGSGMTEATDELAAGMPAGRRRTRTGSDPSAARWQAGVIGQTRLSSGLIAEQLSLPACQIFLLCSNANRNTIPCLGTSSLASLASCRSALPCARSSGRKRQHLIFAEQECFRNINTLRSGPLDRAVERVWGNAEHGIGR